MADTVNIYDMAQEWTASGTTYDAIKMDVTDTASDAASKLLNLAVGGTSQFTVQKDGDTYALGDIALDSDAGGLLFGDAQDVSLYRDAANVLALRNSTAAQYLRIYNTYTDASNNERIRLGFSSNVAYINTTAAGTGTLRNLEVGTDTGARLRFIAASVGAVLGDYTAPDPDGTLHVYTASAGSVTANTTGDDLVVENSTNGGISVLVPDNNQSVMYFGSPSLNVGALVRWKYSTNLMDVSSFRAGASLKLRSGDETDALTLDGDQKWTSGAAQLTDATGDETAYQFDYTVNKATSGDDYGLVVNKTDTASPGSSYLLSLQVASSAVLYVDDAGRVRGPNGNEVNPTYGFTSGEGRGWYYNATTDALIAAVDSRRAFAITEFAIQLGSTWSVQWQNAANPTGDTSNSDLFLYRDAANTLALRNSTNAQTFNLYGTYTDASNYERLGFAHTGSVAAITSEAAGTGTVTPLALRSSAGVIIDPNGAGVTPDGTLHVYTASAGSVTASGSYNDLVIENNDNTGITILAPDASQAGIEFGSPSDQIGAQMSWKKSTNTFEIRTHNTAGKVVLSTAIAQDALTLDADQKWQSGDAQLTDATGDETAYQFDYTVNKATSGADIGIKLTKTDTNSPGTSLLMDLITGATTQFSVSDAGQVSVADNVVTGATDFMHETSAALTDGAGASSGTLTNAPSAGNPAKWIAINDNGTTRYIPTWT